MPVQIDLDMQKEEEEEEEESVQVTSNQPPENVANLIPEGQRHTNHHWGQNLIYLSFSRRIILDEIF